MRVFGILFAVLLSGCANFQEEANTWVGVDRNSLVMAYGAPSATAELGNQRELMQFERYSSYDGYTMHCVVRFTLQDNIVENAAVEGKRGACKHLIQGRPNALR